MNIKTITAVVLATLVAADAQAWQQFGTKAPRYGNPYGNDSNSYQLYSPSGRYMGNLNDNRFDPNSISNRFGRYGNRFSPDSINNPYHYLNDE